MWVVRGVYRRRLVDIEKGSSLDGDGDGDGYGRRARLCLLGTLSSAVGSVTFYRKYQIVGKDGTSIVGCVVRNPFPGAVCRVGHWLKNQLRTPCPPTTSVNFLRLLLEAS